MRSPLDAGFFMEAHMQKRGFNIQEAQAYLGVKRKFFDTNLAPLLAGKGTRAGTATIFERTDLDAAWDTYKEANKLLAGNERPPVLQGATPWGVQTRLASKRRPTARSTSMPNTGNEEFGSVVSLVRQKRKTS
jgi:hypothetical protein